MKTKKYKQIILFLIILPLFLAVILPFFVILKIAFIPEGLAKSDNKELIIWEPSKNYNPQWEHNNANFSQELVENQEDSGISFTSILLGILLLVILGIIIIVLFIDKDFLKFDKNKSNKKKKHSSKKKDLNFDFLNKKKN